MGWKQVEVQQEEEEEEEEDDQDQPHNIDGEAAPAGSRAAVCSSYYNSVAMQQQQEQQQARGDQGSCKEHELGSPVQQTLQLHILICESRDSWVPRCLSMEYSEYYMQEEENNDDLIYVHLWKFLLGERWEKQLEKKLGPQVPIMSTHGRSAEAPIMAVGSAEEQCIMSTSMRLRLKR
ncbi:unnamed protein product [Sphagnum troendelagicum]|uniref:Uncharacterized protein n=1 Tax=Sphagnum troendelagicum TaxID=128251 RepID=A0ABP0U8S1_9BRYO